MIQVRPAATRGTTQIGWLDSRHTFSFGNYYDPRQMGFRALRVINDDRVRGGGGFPTHGHRDMEILTWVLSGALAHRDSTGGEAVLNPGDIQRMSAGNGIRHSEYNASATEPVHFYQIWLEPDTLGIAPRHEDLRIPPAEIAGKLRLIASPDGAEGSSPVAVDARVYVSRLGEGDNVEAALEAGRYAWVQVATGEVEVNGEKLAAGDGAAISGETAVKITAAAPADLLLFDLA